ncbi:fasciclin domain-containing protein [Streptomyces sp. NPDC058892]|uniref:fasciclin domain-containing protein n=1 Tax=unclassified Streptomyces TaxID=2593676 RepID=UPI0036BCAABE
MAARLPACRVRSTDTPPAHSAFPQHGVRCICRLVAAVKQAGLIESLNNAKDITVFAPTNNAFAKIPKVRPRQDPRLEGDAQPSPHLPRRRPEAHLQAPARGHRVERVVCQACAAPGVAGLRFRVQVGPRRTGPAQAPGVAGRRCRTALLTGCSLSTRPV